MAKNNSWYLEGYIGKFPKEKTTKTGKNVFTNSLAVWKGTDEATGEAKYDYIDVTLWEDRIPELKNLAPGTFVAITGKPQANGYINSDGELINKLVMSPNRDGIVIKDRADYAKSNTQPQAAPQEDYSQYSGDAF